MGDVVSSAGNTAYFPDTVRVAQFLSVGHSIPVTVQLTQRHVPLNTDPEMVAITD